jgi:hypothetical protein
MWRGLKIVASALFVSALVLPVSARSSDETDALWLARLCVHETTWAGGLPSVNDCGGIMQVVQNRAGGRSFERTLRAMTPRFSTGMSTRPWARALRAEMRQSPEGWPDTWPPFSTFDERWRAVYHRSLAFVRGDLAPPCAGAPRNWLSRTHPADRALAWRNVEVLRRWRVVDCGETRNEFYEPVP